MKVEVEATKDGEVGLVLSEVYSGILFRTGIGDFGICERDDGILVMKDSKEIFRYDMNGMHVTE